MGNDLPILRQGSGNTMGVLYAQGILYDLGYFTDRADIDSYYGPRTAAAVEKLQGDDGLPVTGEIDRDTWSDLISRWWVL